MLDRYLNDEITITLPDGKKIAELKWFAIYDLSLHDTFGDIYIPEEFEAPDAQVGLGLDIQIQLCSHHASLNLPIHKS